MAQDLAVRLNDPVARVAVLVGVCEAQMLYNRDGVRDHPQGGPIDRVRGGDDLGGRGSGDGSLTQAGRQESLKLGSHGSCAVVCEACYGVRRTLHTGASFLTKKQTARLDAVFAAEEHVEVEATWGIYQRIVAAYREPDKNKAKEMMRAVIDSVSNGVPALLKEIRRLGRTLKQRAADILAFFDRPGTSNGPTEAICE